jgi:soluble lytic murein transglycosylase-like protein
MRKFSLTTILVAFAAAAAPPALAQKQRLMTPDGNLDALIARHAAANNIPEDLVRRVIKRESGGNPRAVSKGNFGLMQIKLASARVITKAPPPRSSFATAAMGHFCHVAVR